MANETITPANETLKDAVFIGNFENGSEEWHEQRSKGIGGSDVGILCGLSEWTSPYTWAAKRLGKIESNNETSEPMEWGNRLEPVILDAFQDKYPDIELWRDAGTWHHKDRAWQQANPDALYTADGGNTWGIVEVKTARYEDQWKQSEDGKNDVIPPTYRAQVLWYLQTFGLTHAYVVVLFSGSKFRVFEVHYDAFEADANLQKVSDFLAEFVNKETLPPFSAPFNSTLETVRFMHPDIEDAEVELGIEGVDYFEAIRELEKAQAEVDAAKADILARMGNAKRGILNGQWVLTRQARGGGVPYLVAKK